MARVLPHILKIEAPSPVAPRRTFRARFYLDARAGLKDVVVVFEGRKTVVPVAKASGRTWVEAKLTPRTPGVKHLVATPRGPRGSGPPQVQMVAQLPHFRGTKSMISRG
jgi:hypothetical protein